MSGFDLFETLDEDLEISAIDLDQEWLRQPNLYMKYAAHSARLHRDAAMAKEKYKVIEAQLKSDAAEDPDGCLGQGVKVSDAKLTAYAITHPEYIKAKETAIDDEFRAAMALNAVFAFQQRKDALENLVRLQGMEYFSTPSVKREINREFDKKAKTQKAIENVKKARRRT